MRVAISDSDKRFCRKVDRILKKYEEQERIHVEMELFSDDGCLCRKMMNGRLFDLIILDALWVQSYYGEAEAVDIGSCLQKIMGGYDTKIVYVRFQQDQAVELSGRPPSGHLVKPIRKKRIFALLDELQKLHNHRLFSYIRERVMYQVPYAEILFFQSDGRKVEIHTINSDKPQQYTGKLSQLLEQGLPPDFIAIHKSYIVNIGHIVKRSYELVFLDRRFLWLSISQAHRRHVREVLEQYPIERVSDEEAAAEFLQQNFL